MGKFWLFVVSILFYGALTSTASGQPLGTVPKGVTGLEIGSYVTLEGFPEQSKFFNFKVEIVNGQKLKQPVFLYVDNVPLTSKDRYVLKGYESLRMIGFPPAINLARKQAGQPPFGESGIAWQVHYYFVALSVVSPKGVKLIPRN